MKNLKSEERNPNAAIKLGETVTSLLLLAATASAALPESIAPTNTLPPAAGSYVLWPPETTVIFNGTLAYLGTNHPAIFHLQEIAAGPFTNIVRTVSGNDLLLEFDAEMETHIPFVNLAGDIHTKLALYDQLGHFRIRVKEGGNPTANRLTLIMETFSWRYQARTVQGVYYDFVHVRNATNRVSSGWVETTQLPDGRYLMQSDLWVYPEGILLPPPGMDPPFTMNYTLAGNAPVRLVLKGIARTLQVLHVVRTDEGRFQMHSSYLGPGYRYGLEYTTNGTDWTDFTVPTVFGDTVSWFDNLESWSESTTNASVKWFRLKAQARP